jgi:hypothetical protein
VTDVIHYVLLRLVGLAQPTLRQQKVYVLRSVVMVEISVFMNAMMATICGVMGNLQSLYHNLYRCDGECNIEIGYNCSGGSPTTPDKCQEICGDGRNFGNY